MDLVLVGIGGMLGGLCRFQLGKIISRWAEGIFPAATFIINVTGAVLLGILTSSDVGGWAYLALGDGFLGAFTTFSTFMYEGAHLFQEHEKLSAFAYVLGSLLLGVLGFAAGCAVGRWLIFR